MKKLKDEEEEYAEDEAEVEDEAPDEDEGEHDCGCGVCEMRGEKLAAMSGHASDDAPTLASKAHEKGGAPNLMIVMGGPGPQENPRRNRMFEALAKKSK